MQLEYGFTVPVSPARAWSVLLDVERVAPCVPGATLTSFDGSSFAGTVRVRLGPVSLTYQGKGRFVSREPDAGRVVIEASGRDARGGGTAAATATMTLRPAAEGASTEVAIVADLAVTGRPAQFGRGMIAEVGGKLVGQFATCLAGRLAEAPAATPVEAGPGGAGPGEATPGGAGPAVAGPGGAGPGVVAAGAQAPPNKSDLSDELVAGAPGVAPTAPDKPDMPGESPADRVAPVAAEAVAAQSAVGAQAPAPPVDLLRLGAGPVLRRAAPLVLGLVAVGLVIWAVVAWLS